MANGTIAVSQLEILTQSGTGIITVVPPATNTNRTLTLPDSTGTIATAESTLTQFSASGSAPVYAARAWVNFNGTGTVAILGSGNVTSITDNGTGDYTLNFTTAISDANYSAVGCAGRANDGNNFVGFNTNTYSTTQVRFTTKAAGTTPANTDMTGVYISIFR